MNARLTSNLFLQKEKFYKNYQYIVMILTACFTGQPCIGKNVFLL